MKIELTKVDGKVVGYTIEGETHEEKLTVNAIRNMQFFGFGDTVVKYNGREGGDQDYAGKLKFIQKKFIKDEV